jgi:hypothetical protein
MESLPSTLREYVYTDINLSQSDQFASGSNEGYNEIWWQYCSANSDVIDRYVIYNYLDNVWYYGDWSNYTGTAYQGRTAWLDSPLRAYPMAATYGVAGGTTNTLLLYHENGTDDGTVNPPVPIVSQITSSDFDIGDGEQFTLIKRIIPDVSFDGSDLNENASPTATFTMRPRNFPGSSYGTSPAKNVITTNVTNYTDQVFMRARARQMAMEISSEDMGVQWQLGSPRVDGRPDGKR